MQSVLPLAALRQATEIERPEKKRTKNGNILSYLSQHSVKRHSKGLHRYKKNRTNYPTIHVH